MLGGILKPCVLSRTFGVVQKFCLRRTFGVAAGFCPGYRHGRKVKFCYAEFCGKAPKLRLYKILKTRFGALKFYPSKGLKCLSGGLGLYGATSNTNLLKFYCAIVKKIRIAEKFSENSKFYFAKFRCVIKFHRPKFYLLAKFYCSFKFKRLQYCATSAMPYARSGFCR